LTTKAELQDFNREDMMRLVVSMSLAACAFASVLALASSATLAQTPTPAPATPPSAGGTPDVMPFDIPYGQSIGLEHAKQVIAAAEVEAKRRNWKMNIAVVDTNGEPVMFERMEGAQIASGSISIGKARTAARFRRESRLFYNAFETGHGYVATLDPTLVASPGGFPLVEGGKLIGAVGCSGGTGDQDAAICKVGAEVVK
jgi:glc operon protein GlcG